MIWQAWAILVLAGLGSAYLAFVEKRAPVYTSLASTGIFAVAAIGSLEIETQFTTSMELGIAILCALQSLLGTLVFIAALTGQYGEPDDEDTPTGGVEHTAQGSWFDRIARALT